MDSHLRAARLFRFLRRKGVTVRGAVNRIVARACLDIVPELLSPDVAFRRIERHTRLCVWGEESGDR